MVGGRESFVFQAPRVRSRFNSQWTLKPQQHSHQTFIPTSQTGGGTHAHMKSAHKQRKVGEVEGERPDETDLQRGGVCSSPCMTALGQTCQESYVSDVNYENDGRRALHRIHYPMMFSRDKWMDVCTVDQENWPQSHLLSDSENFPHRQQIQGRASFLHVHMFRVTF